MENYKKKAIQLLVDLSLTVKHDPSVIPYAPAKLRVSEKELKYFPRKYGGDRFKYSRVLSDMMIELEAERRANIHSIMVIKDGAVIAEASHPGYDTNVFHLAHSMSKTVTGLAVGFLFDEGKLSLEDKVISFFPEVSYKDTRFSDMTLFHLLTMKSGVPFAELGTVTEAEWTKAFFESELEYAPGESFAYNSMNSYILASIVTRVCGKSLTEYINEKLFTPLKIENFLWEISPEGIEKGGFGLYLSCESFAKIGVLLIGGGYFEGKRIISEKYISLMLDVHSYVQDSISGFDYGLHVWVNDTADDFLLNGMLGQNVWVCPKTGVTVSLNCGNNELFSQSPTLAIIKKHLSFINEAEEATRADFKRFKAIQDSFFEARHWIRPLEEKRGLPYFLKLKNSRPFDKRWDKALGSYALRDNNASLLPLFVSVMQNNFIGGIEKIALERRSDILELKSTEGGIDYVIPVGLYDFVESIMDYRGEKYVVRAIAEAMEDEDRNPIYKIELIFPELPNTRMLKITHTDEGILLRMSELPNQRIAESFFSSMAEGKKFGFIMNLIEKKMGDGFFKSKLECAFNPAFEAISTERADYKSVIERDNTKLAEEREKSAKFIKSLMSKFLNDERGEKSKEEKGGIQGFFAKALSLLFQKAKSDDSRAKEESECDSNTVINIPDDVITFLDYGEHAEEMSKNFDIE